MAVNKSSDDRTTLATDASGQVIHQPVMLDEILDLFEPALAEEGAIYVDGTLGMAGHASAVLTANPNAHLIGIDRDADALSTAGKKLEPFGDRVQLVQARFDELPVVLDSLGVPEVHAILLDLGLSSLQIDRRDRGFAYSVDAPLDMRMDARQELDAAAIINEYSEADLVRIFRKWGEEPQAARIARAIVKAREAEPFTTSARLVDVIAGALPAAVRHSGGHPAKRVFQALRIEVNGELDALENVLPPALEAVALNGRMAVLSYHSLEDRLVKRTFAAAASDDAPPKLPIVPEHRKAKFALLTRGAGKPTEAEIAANSRSTSARLRAIQRIRPRDLSEVSR